MKKLLGFSLGLLLMLPLAACGGGSSSSGDDTLVVGVSYENVTMDPDLLPIQQMWVYLNPVYDSLTRLDGDGKVLPMLASEWTAGEDGSTKYLDMKLEEGLTFPDGSAFTADAVVANIERSSELEGSTNAAWFAGITATTVGEYEVRLASETGVGQLPAILAGPAGMMISPKAIEEKTDLTKVAAGIAPYSLESVEPARIVYTANDDYWNPDDIGTEKLEFVSMPDDAMLTAMLAGDVHVAAQLPQRMLETAKSSGLTVSTEPGNVSFLYAVNTTIKPFDNPKVREAMSLALDRQAFCDSVWGGQCSSSYQFFGPRTPYYDDSIGEPEFDLERAKQLIKEAGAEGATFEHVIPAGIAAQKEWATYTHAQWTEIGLKPKLTELPPAQVVGRFTQEKNAAVTNGAGGLAFDPSIEVGRYLVKDGLYNIGHIDNAELEKLAVEGKEETDQDARIEIYKKISALAVQDGWIIPGVTQFNSFTLSPKVKGWSQPWGANFNNIRGVTLSD